jgi:glutamate racemase
MKIGIFDSGLGGLIVTRSLIRAMPQYDFVYLGDTARVPYGNRSQEAIYAFTKEGVEYLFKQDCKLVILACNTASAEALRKIQQELLPQNYPDRRVLGVLIPAAEEVVTTTKNNRVGIIATKGTTKSTNSTQLLKFFNKRPLYSYPWLKITRYNMQIQCLTIILRRLWRQISTHSCLAARIIHYSKRQFKPG